MPEDHSARAGQVRALLGLVWFYAGVAMWWADAAFGLVAWRLRAVSRWGAPALAIGSVLAFLGMDRLELVQGDLA